MPLQLASFSSIFYNSIFSYSLINFYPNFTETKIHKYRNNLFLPNNVLAKILEYFGLHFDSVKVNIFLFPWRFSQKFAEIMNIFVTNMFLKIIKIIAF